MEKNQYDHLPPKLEAVGNGSHLYRWEIEEITSPDGDQLWQCYEVLVWGNPTRENVIEAAIIKKWGVNIEAKLINDYNASIAGVLDVAFKIPYLDFLAQRVLVKTEINAYFDGL
jgi:hypothetical protein